MATEPELYRYGIIINAPFILGGSNYTRFRSRTGADLSIAEGVMNRWSHVFHIYTGTNVQVYVIINPVRTGRVRTSTGEITDFGRLLGK